MFLENVRPQKRNSNVTVNQTIYRIGPGGFITTEEDPKVPFDVPDGDARKLLAGKSWKPLSWDPADPGNAKRFIDQAGGYPEKRGLGRAPRDMSGIREQFGGKPVDRQQLPPQAIGTGSRSGELSGAEEAPLSDAELSKAIQRDQTLEQKDAGSGKRVADAQMSSSETVLMGGGAAVGDGKAPAAAVAAAQAQADQAAAAGRESTIVDPPVPTDGDWPEPTSSMSVAYLKQMADAYDVKYTKNVNKKTLIKRNMAEMYE